MRQRALLMEDLENIRYARRLETQSDVFALHQEEVCPYILWTKIVITSLPIRASCTPALAMALSDASTLGREHQGQLYLAKCLPNRPTL